MTEVQIYNLALISLDVAVVTTTADAVDPARKLLAIFDHIRDDMLSKHPWNFARKRFTRTITAKLRNGSGLDDLTNTAVFTGTVPLNYRVEIDAEGTPDTFKWSDDGGSTWDVETVAITGAAQTLNNGITITFAATTGHTDGDYWDFSGSVTPAFELAYSYILPSDCLRAIRLDDKDAKWYLENIADTKVIITDESAIDVYYIQQVTTVSLFSQGFAIALAARLAAEVCFGLTNSKTLTELKWEEYGLKLKEGKSIDAQEGTPEEIEDLGWIDDRG